MRLMFTLAGAAALAATTSCALVATPVMGGLYNGVKYGTIATENAGSTKNGTGQAMSILGLVGVGDISIKSAADKGGITKIHHVDYETFSVLGIFGTLTIKVYGE